MNVPQLHPGDLCATCGSELPQNERHYCGTQCDAFEGAWPKKMQEPAEDSNSIDGVDSPTEFRFIEFNTRRAQRGAEAARVTAVVGNTELLLWMGKADITRNMMIHGRHPELEKAHAAYVAAEALKQ